MLADGEAECWALPPEEESPSGTAMELTDWTLSFPEGWGAPGQMKLDGLKAWKDLPMTAEGRACETALPQRINIKK